MYSKNKPTKLILCTIITTIIAVVLSLSKYQSTKANSSSSSVAAPILSFSSNTLEVSISPKNNEKVYFFTVQNYDESSEKTSEVSMGYTLQINNLANLPLDFELYTYDNEEEGSYNLLENSPTTDTISIPLEKTTHTYELKIKWQDGQDSYLYSGEIDYVQIILDGVQID